MEKVILSGEAGSLKLKIEGGVAELDAQGVESLGGGAAAGVLSVEGDAKIKLSAAQGADLAIALLEGHFPSLTGVLEAVKSGVHSLLK